jgi:alpha-tubulin suppressor-like RCC1 family protein
MSWGANGEGQLGDGKPGNRATPVRVKLPSGSRVTALAAGNAHSLALTTSGRVLAWGNDRSGELGNGSTHNRLSPVRVKLPSGTKVTVTSV